MSPGQPFPAARVLGEEEPDELLVERCREGDREAFAALVRRYQRPIFHAAYRVLGREEDAADVTQAVFLKMVEKLRDFDPRYRFFSWIYRIGINEALNVLRRNGRDQPLDEEDEPEGPASAGPEWLAAEAETSRHIQRALMRMKPMDRAVITLRHFSDCSYEEIAQVLEIDVKTVKSRLFEARARMRGLLAELRPLPGAEIAS
jgi:RNA polymerase sigma-70 factor, ECF subfamily